MISKALTFLKSFSFLKGIMKTIAMLLPMVVGWYTGYLAMGVSMGLSVLVISPSDIPGNRRHHIGGLLLATFLAMFSSLCVNLSYPYPYLLVPVIFVLTFVNAYISLYGFRASMVAISGLFSIGATLAHIRTGADIAWQLLYIFMGGLWFIALVLLYLRIKPRQYSEQLLGECFSLTADFFSVRADLLLSSERNDGIRKMIDLQTKLNDNYEKLREVILDSRSKSGRTNYLQRQFLMFIELVDIFELALANPVQYEKIDVDFANDKKVLQAYAAFLDELSTELRQMSVYIGSRNKIILSDSLSKKMAEAKAHTLKIKAKAREEGSEEKLLTLRNFNIYIENQYKTFENIRAIFDNYYKKEVGERNERTYRRFVSIQSYSWRRLKDHFTLQSTFFRHALRLSLTVTVAYLLGDYFSINNAYWIIFTVFIIMRPGFAITKERSRKRILGTIVGGIIAFGIVYLLPYPTVYISIGVLCMPLAFGLIQQNYTAASAFITLSVVFLYAFYTPDLYSVMQYRVLDTAAGVVLASLANYWILPTWEYRTYDDSVVRCIKAVIGYLGQVQKVYNTESGITDAYKISRKEAFLALSNLNAAFQRMMQEPKSKQIDGSVYRVTVLLQSFLASVASIGVRMKQTRHTFPKEVFNAATDGLLASLEQTLCLLENKKNTSSATNITVSQVNKAVKDIVEDHKTQENASDNNVISMRETHHYSEQFNYLYGLADNLQEAIKKKVTETMAVR
ncbi:MAG: FUSC family membrane protein [Capnocytophaga sp.]|nr:FUSC family membrane protein [Capnocytophaga sp.]